MLNTFTKFAFFILIFLLVVNIFAYEVFETTDEVVTFSGLLDRLDEAPIIEFDLSTSVDTFKINDDWGAFDFLRSIINSLGAVIGFAVWVCTLFINIVIILGYLLYLLGLSSFSTFV